MTRKEAREQAFKLIFEKSFREESMTEIIEDSVADLYIDHDEFADTAAIGVYDNLEEIDGIIKSNLKSWTIDRLSRVALAALRLSVYEIKFMPDVPVGASINEAVELTKKYASPEDSAYINGVLGTIARQDDGENNE